MVVVAFPWLLSAMTCAMLWLMGSRSKWGPRIGLASQPLWIVYCILTHQWGLLPGVVVYTFIQARNLLRWEKV